MRLVGLLVVTAFALTACEGSDEPADGHSEIMAGDQAGALTPAQVAFAEANERMHAAMSEIPPDADEAFMRGMLAHHRGAVEMAEVELTHGTDPEARALAQTIIEAQSAEIEQMEAWLAREAQGEAQGQAGGGAAAARPEADAADHTRHSMR